MASLVRPEAGSGVFPRFNFLEKGTTLPCSYLHGPDGECPRFEDPNIGRYSLLPELEINGQKISFLLVQKKFVLCVENRYLGSLKEVFENITLPKNLNKEILNKIAMIASYLIDGTAAVYEDNTAQLKGRTLCYSTKKGGQPIKCNVDLSCCLKKCEIKPLPTADKYQVSAK